jgi:hypothetical protein
MILSCILVWELKLGICCCVQNIRLIWGVFDLIWIYGWKACFMELIKEMEIKVLNCEIMFWFCFWILITPPCCLVKLSNLICLDVHTITIKVVFCLSSHHPNNCCEKTIMFGWMCPTRVGFVVILPPYWWVIHAYSGGRRDPLVVSWTRLVCSKTWTKFQNSPRLVLCWVRGRQAPVSSNPLFELKSCPLLFSTLLL